MLYFCPIVRLMSDKLSHFTFDGSQQEVSSYRLTVVTKLSFPKFDLRGEFMVIRIFQPTKEMLILENVIVGPIGCRPYSCFCLLLLLLLLQCRPSSPFPFLPFPPLKLIFCLPSYRATFWSATLPLRWAGQREGVCNIAADART